MPFNLAFKNEASNTPISLHNMNKNAVTLIYLGPLTCQSMVRVLRVLSNGQLNSSSHLLTNSQPNIHPTRHSNGPDLCKKAENFNTISNRHVHAQEARELK